MDSPVIGIKIANGTFFPILNSEDRIKKRVILTPVAEGQTDVKIDIFRGDGEGMFNPVYVASLILNNIEADADKGTEIELLIGISDENILDAEAYDKISGEKQLLSISLEALDETDFFEIPDEDESSISSFNAEIAGHDEFDADSLDDDFYSNEEDLLSEELPSDEYFDDELSTVDDLSQESALPGDEKSDLPDEVEEDESRYLYNYEKNRSDKQVSALKTAIVFLSIVFLIFLVLLIYTIIKKPAAAEFQIKEETGKEIVVETEKKMPEALPVPAPAPAPAEKKAEPAEKKEVPVPASEEKKPAAPKTVRYRIKRGDTLWDISSAYYRTPWLYKKIAKDNNIKNPDLIYAGAYINIKE